VSTDDAHSTTANDLGGAQDVLSPMQATHSDDLHNDDVADDDASDDASDTAPYPGSDLGLLSGVSIRARSATRPKTATRCSRSSHSRWDNRHGI
jgi:hypothetical protein